MRMVVVAMDDYQKNNGDGDGDEHDDAGPACFLSLSFFRSLLTFVSLPLVDSVAEAALLGSGRVDSPCAAPHARP